MVDHAHDLGFRPVILFSLPLSNNKKMEDIGGLAKFVNFSGQN